MSRRNYNITESLNRILRSFKGLTQNDEPGTLAGEVLSDNQAYSDLAELLNDSLPGEILLLPTALKNAVASAGFAITGSASSSNLDIVTGTSVVVDNVTSIILGSRISASVTGSVVYVDTIESPLLDWSPTVTQGVGVTGSVVYAKYQQVGKVIHFWATINILSAGTAANDVVFGGLPFSSLVAPIGIGYILDNGVGFYVGILRASTTNFRMRAYLETDDVGSDPSFALANGDVAEVVGSYTIA